MLTDFNFARYTANSAFLAVTITLSNLFLASIGGYAFARLRFPGREALFMLVLATLMIPDQLRLVPVFQMLTNWGLVSTYQGYVMIKLVAAVNLFLMRQYFLTIPRDYEEAAKLDGAGFFKTYWRVMLPLAAPALAAVTILEFQGIWNEFFWPLIILQDESVHAHDRDLQLRRHLQHAVARAHGRERDRDPARHRDLPRLPALLHHRRRGGRGEGLVGGALRAAAADFYRHSWRLVLLNALLSLAVVPLLVLALWAPLLLVPAAWSPARSRALMHCAVVLAETEELPLRERARRAPPALAARARARSGGGPRARGGRRRRLDVRRAGAWPLAALALYLLSHLACSSSASGRSPCASRVCRCARSTAPRSRWRSRGRSRLRRSGSRCSSSTSPARRRRSCRC